MDFITQLFPQDILYALGWTVVHSLWQAFIVASIASIVLLALQKQSSKARYLVANAALLIVPIWAFFTFTNLSKEGALVTEFALASQPSNSYEVAGGLGQKLNSWMVIYFEQHLPLIVTIWLAGQAFFWLKMMGGLFYIQQLKRRHLTPLDGYWQMSLKDMSAKLGMKKAVRLAESAMVKVPMVVGWIKPVILMPVGAVNNLTSGQVEAILAHELAHIFRYDYLLNILQSFIETLFYYNPAVWWISANVRSERENCCDDIAISLCGNSLTYAKALVSLQEMHQAAPSFAMPFSKNKNQLLNRIKRVLQQPQNKSNVMEKLSATLLLLAAVVMLSVQANTPFGNLLDRVVLKKTNPSADVVLVIPSEWDDLDYQIQNDTIPGKKGKGKNEMFLRKHNDDEDIEITFKDDKIVSLKINGREIPKEEFGQYEGLAEQMLEELENIPDPPMPPPPPLAPAVPNFHHFQNVPAPPVPPPPPSADWQDRKVRKIITKKDGNGTTFIIETAPGSDPVRIELKDGKKGTITINGQEIKDLKKGEQTVIIAPVPNTENNFFGRLQLEKLNNGALAFPSPDYKLRFEPGQFHLAEPGNNNLFYNKDGLHFAPDNGWHFFGEGMELNNRLQQEFQERFKDGNMSKEFLEKFKGDMNQPFLAPQGFHLEELRARMEEESARLKEHQQLFKGEYLQQLEQLKREQLEQRNLQLEEIQRQLQEYKLQEKKRSSNKRLINNTENE